MGDISINIENISSDEEIIVTLDNDQDTEIVTIDNSQAEMTVSVENDDSLISINIDDNVSVRKGYSPYISTETLTWWEYNDATQEFEDTNISPGTAAITKVKVINDTADSFNLLFNENLPQDELTTPTMLKDNYITNAEIDAIIAEVENELT